jgi:hypothetical protein
MSDKRRFANAGDASKELFDGFNDWCSAFSSHSLQSSYAIIAANWAVHSNAHAILSNIFAKLSMATITAFLVINPLLCRWMILLYKKRCNFTDQNKKQWEVEFNETEKESSCWPYTKLIEILGESLRALKTWAPIISGILFIFSLFIF